MWLEARRNSLVIFLMSYFINYEELFKALTPYLHSQNTSNNGSYKADDSIQGKTSSTPVRTNAEP